MNPSIHPLYCQNDNRFEYIGICGESDGRSCMVFVIRALAFLRVEFLFVYIVACGWIYVAANVLASYHQVVTW